MMSSIGCREETSTSKQQPLQWQTGCNKYCSSSTNHSCDTIPRAGIIDVETTCLDLDRLAVTKTTKTAKSVEANNTQQQPAMMPSNMLSLRKPCKCQRRYKRKNDNSLPRKKLSTLPKFLPLLLFAYLSSTEVSSFVATQPWQQDRALLSRRQQQPLHQRRPRSSSIIMLKTTNASASASSSIEPTQLIPPSTDDDDSTTSSCDDPLRALGWESHFANQLNDAIQNVNNNSDADDDDDNGSDGRGPTLVPLRVTEVRSKSIHAVGLAVAGSSSSSSSSTTSQRTQQQQPPPQTLRQFVIPITPGIKITNTNEERCVVAGDWIVVERNNDNDNGSSSSSDDEGTLDATTATTASSSDASSPPRMKSVLLRKSSLKRRAPGRNVRRAQVIAANLDTVFVVSSCNQDFNVARLERYIAMVLETENVEPVIVLTKRDLLLMGDDDEDDEEEMEDKEMDFQMESDDEKDCKDNGEYDNISEEEMEEDFFDPSWLLDYYLDEASSIADGSIPVVCLNALDRTETTSLLSPYLGPGRTVAFVGSSGVGKSTLTNTLVGTTVAPTGEFHVDSGQGRHTTTRRQLHFVDDGALLLDTPGLREVQLVDAARGIRAVFADLEELASRCRFRDCKHEGEPGCAIAEAVERGDVDPDRVARWEKLAREDRANSDELDEGRRMAERKGAASAGRRRRAKEKTMAGGKEIRKRARKKRN